ncbi:hypothetical protein ACVWW2_007036 [Bradyrhizobium sp. LM4.3]
MERHSRLRIARVIGAALLVAAISRAASASEPVIAPSRMTVIDTIDPRFQSYNVEMVEVTGGRFWRPYAQHQMQRDGYSDRPPIDLANRRLRKLAAALAPAYLRVSGTWANATYFADGDDAPGRTACRLQHRAQPRAMAWRYRLRPRG